MKKITNFFISNSKLTIVLSIGLVLFGYEGLKKMNSESYPAVSFATATVVTFYDGATATDIETKITRPIENEIRGVNGLRDVKSTSQAGVSNITIRVDMDDSKINVNEVMNEIQKAVDRVTNLPKELKNSPKFTELKSDEFPVIEIAIIGKNTERSRDKLADLMKEEIEDNRSVKNVRLVGFKKRVFDILLDLDKINEKHISVSEILSKIRQRNTNTPGGALKTQTSQSLVRVEGKIIDAQTLKEIVVRSNFTGSTVTLGDISEVRDSEEEIKTLTRYNGKEATLLIVTKKAGADTIEMVRQLNSILKNYSDLNPEYKINVYNSEGIKVKNRVNVLISNAFTGLILVVIFLFIFLPGKIGIAASFSLPLAMAGTLGIMPIFGMNIDAITVLALVIALGMMVDNSVVISENFTRLRQNGLNVREAAEKIYLKLMASYNRNCIYNNCGLLTHAGY